ncbi:hypothetical protein [Emticicia soli]|uniref:Uncharacterized protein n=1 Tax=Emticicia soli TaxID=2027878 RepID=A0ABW5J3H0_9BACT
MKEINLHKAIEAIQALIIEAKVMATQEKSHLEIYNFLDELEYLPFLLIDKKETFADYLKEVCKKFNCEKIYKKFVE